MNPTLSISASTIAKNYSTLLRANGYTKAAAVIKANGYGLGDTRIIDILTPLGCTNYFVATIDEAIKCRAHNRDIAIYALNGLGSDPTPFKTHNITPVINTLQELELWDEPNVVLHIDTGMSRLGISVDEFHTLTIKPKMILSHFSDAETPEKSQTLRQIETMKSLQTHCDILSLDNSAGCFIDHNISQMPRLGIGLYGGLGLEPVITLKSPILQINHVPKGQPISYGGTFVTERDSVIATLPIGYADGLKRQLSNQLNGFYDNTPLPFVGTITMDLSMVDITDYSSNIAVGDTIEIINHSQTIADIAKKCCTIEYEVLTSLGSRIKRFTV